MDEDKEKGQLIKDSLIIVEKLSKLMFEDSDELLSIEYELYKLTRQANRITRNKYWKLR